MIRRIDVLRCSGGRPGGVAQEVGLAGVGDEVRETSPFRRRAATGMERVLARIDAIARLVEENPALMRMLFAVEFQGAGKGSSMADRVAGSVGQLRNDTLEGLREGQRDGSIGGELDAEDTAHAITVEGVGSAFLWTVDPAEDFRRRIDQWRARTVKTLKPVSSSS
jgi:hypothetical protein